MSSRQDVTEALAALERVERDQIRRVEVALVERSTNQPKAAAPAPIRLLDHHPAAEAQRRREGEALLFAMRTAGVGGGAEWMAGNGLMRDRGRDAA